MSLPTRIQRSRAKGWRMPEGAIYVGRPSRWGNPFRVWNNGMGWPVVLDPKGTAYLPEQRLTWEAARRWAVELHRQWLRYPTRFTIVAPPDLTALRGHDLCCWCPLDQPCHADVLIEIANG